MWPTHPGSLSSVRIACQKGISGCVSAARVLWSRLTAESTTTSQDTALPLTLQQRLANAKDQVSVLTAEIKASRGQAAALADSIRVQDLPLTITQKLARNEQEVQSQVYRSETETQRTLASSRLQLLDLHKKRGWAVGKTDFEELERLWAEYAALKNSTTIVSTADSMRSSSTWTLTQLAEYIPEFWVLPWCSKTSTQSRSLESLEMWLKTESYESWSTEAIEASAVAGALPGLCQDTNWQEQYLSELDQVLLILGCEADLGAKVGTDTGKRAPHTPNAPRAPFHRLAGLSKLGAKEAASRCVIDKLVFPLLDQLDVQVTLEEYVRCAPVPVSICDYVLRRRDRRGQGGQGGQVLGALEAKRCSDGYLAQGAAQCILQLLGLWMDTRHQTADPLLGIVTDGRYWLCLRLHQRYVAVTPLLDASQEVQFWTLLRFLALNLSQFVQKHG